MLAPVADTWAQALALQAAPAEIAATAARYGRSADIIWRAAGDRSTDMNWYSKRGLLIGAYVATELHMLTDCSPGFADSWTFLDRRLADAMALGRAAGQAASAVGGAAGLAGVVTALGDMLRPPPRPL
jgi:ubiquinone biosynthesis protein COQ9